MSRRVPSEQLRRDMLNETQIIRRLCELIDRRFKRSRLQSPDYKRTLVHSPQWRALGCVNYWSLDGRVYALVEVKSRLGLFWSRGVSERWMHAFERRVREVAGG